MRRYRAWIVVGMMLSLGNLGCYYDQWKNEERAHRVTQEKLSEVQDDLQNAELQNAQKDTKIAALTDQLNTKDQMINSLQAEAANLRDALAKAQAILEKQAGRGAGEVTVIHTPLPPALNDAITKLAEQYPDLISVDPKTGAVRFKADLLFPLGSDKLTADSKAAEAIGKFAEIVNSADAAPYDIIVVGHTCTTPIRKAETLAEHKTNWHLSAHRAISIMQVLASKNVAETRMGVMGYGEFRPIAENSSDEGKAKNRRVEVYLVPHESVKSVGQGVYQTKDQGITFAKPKPAEHAQAGKPKAEKPKAGG